MMTRTLVAACILLIGSAASAQEIQEPKYENCYPLLTDPSSSSRHHSDCVTRNNARRKRHEEQTAKAKHDRLAPYWQEFERLKAGINGDDKNFQMLVEKAMQKEWRGWLQLVTADTNDLLDVLRMIAALQKQAAGRPLCFDWGDSCRRSTLLKQLFDACSNDVASGAEPGGRLNKCTRRRVEKVFEDWIAAPAEATKQAKYDEALKRALQKK
jgi:hypothetical protein